MPRTVRGNCRSQWRETTRLALLFPLALLAACRTVLPPEDTAALPERVDAAVRLPADADRFVVDPDASEIRLLVYRAGPLARFGHNHVITGRVRGEIRAGRDAAGSGFLLQVSAESFVVDSPAARAEEGEEFSAEVSTQAREATRDTMLGTDVLDGVNHPLIEIGSLALAGPRWNPNVIARAKLRGATRDLRFPAAVFEQGDALAVIASFRIRQSDFGITPFTTLGGGLQVRDAIDIRVRVLARASRS